MATQFSGGTYVNATFTGNVRSDIQINIAAQLVNAGWANKTGATGAGTGAGNAGVVTITSANPGVVTLASHGFLGGERIILQTTGNLPSNLSPNTVYFVKYVDGGTFNLSTSLGGGNINTSGGSPSGTHTLNTESFLLESATQSNVTNPIRVRLIDNRANCIQVHIENQAGTVKSGSQTNSSSGGSLLPATSKTFRVLATRYHFLCFTPGASAAREFVMAGMPYVPSLLTSVTDIGYMFSNCDYDGSGYNRCSIRYGPSLTWGGSAGGSGSANVEVLYNASFLENYSNAGNAQTVGFPNLLITNVSDVSPLGRLCHYRWANDDIDTSDVLVSSGLGSTSDEAKIKGQLFDMIFIADAFAGDSTDTFNSHTWWNVTANNTGSAGGIARGGIWVATS